MALFGNNNNLGSTSTPAKRKLFRFIHSFIHLLKNKKWNNYIQERDIKSLFLAAGLFSSFGAAGSNNSAANTTFNLPGSGTGATGVAPNQTATNVFGAPTTNFCKYYQS